MPADCVYPDAVDAHDAGNTLTGRQPARGIPVRPRAHHAGYPPEALFFPQAVELRLRKIRGSLAQDIVAAAQFAVFTLQFLQTLTFSGAQSAVTCTGIALILTQPGTQGLRRTADFRGDGADGRPLRVIVILAFDNHTNGPLTDLRGKARIFSHPVYLSLKEFSLQDSRGDSVTFEEACLRWLEEKADKKSLDSDKSRIEFWLEHFEGIRLKDISEAKIYSAVSRMHNRKTKEIWKQKVQAAIRKGKEPPVYEPKPVSTQTKAKHLAMIKAILRAAERDWKWLEKAPVIKIPAVRNKRVRWLEKEEAKRLIDECPEPLKSVVKFALATGLRKSNIINLEWQQIDMQRRVAWVNPEESKSNRAIGVALNDTACKVLRDQIGKHHKWVFVHTKAAKRADGTSTPAVRKMRIDSKTSWLSACRRAGIEDFRFHDLRHTWASWLIQSGVPLSVLQEMGGWESIEMVRRYAHLAPNHLTEHARKIDDIFGDNVPNMSHCGIMEDIKKA